MLMFTLSSIMLWQIGAAQERPKIYVEPAENIFYTDETSVGYEFDVSIMAGDWVEPGVYSYEFKLYYDNSMLEAVAASLPEGHWMTPTEAPSNIFVVDGGTINQEEGYVSFALTLMGTESGKTGGGTFATITLKITAAPEVGETLSCDLAIIRDDLIVVDPSAVQIPQANYDVIDGVYQYISPPPPKPWLMASSHVWDDKSADAAGRLFSITVTINDLLADWHVVGIQFYLKYNATLLETKPERIYEGDFLKQFGDTYFIAYVDKSKPQGLNDTIVGQLVLPAEAEYPPSGGWPEGSGTVATIEFNAIYHPPPAAYCNLTLHNVLLVDAEGNVVEYERLEHGRYDITVAAPPWLSVTPKTVEVEKEGNSFDLNVAINELDKGFSMVGVEFKVSYDSTLLGITEEDIKEGEFLEEFATRVGTDTFFQAYVEEDYGLIGIIILPLPNGTWPLDVFPEGTGVLATLKFTSISQAETEDITTQLQVYDVLLVDVDAKEIPLNTEKTAAEGTCTCTLLKKFAPPPAERVIDIYTQYSDPYGGQGLDKPSDAFAPQGQVELYSEVTYRGDGVPGKPVTYRIQGPKGYEFVAIEFTKSVYPVGTALLEFSIPASSSYFGLWEVTASVDIAGEVVTDHLTFRVGWLIEVKSITIEPDEGIMPIGEGIQKVYKGKEYTIDVSLNIITMQHPTKCVQLQGLTPKVILAYSGFDELKQPLFYKSVDITSSIEQVSFDPSFVENEETRDFSNAQVSICIPFSAYSGVGTVYGNILTDLPTNNGVPYSDPSIGRKQVWISFLEGLIPPPPPPPTSEGVLQVSSKVWDNAAADAAGRIFTVTVTINDVDPDWHITAIQFEVEFDQDLLEVLEVVEGDFVKQFGDTYFVYYVENNILVGELQLPPWPGENGWMRGSGTVATIQFYATYEPPPSGSCDLTLVNAFMVDADANEIEFQSLQNGYYEITP